MSTSFTQKIIQAKFTLATGTFNGVNNTKTTNALKVSCRVEKHSHPSKNMCKLQVYGMTDSDIQALNTLSFKPMGVTKNIIEVKAGDANGMNTCFSGEITEAWAVYQSPPNLYLHVEALSGYYPAIAPIVPKSYPGGVPVSTIMRRLAADMSYSFEDGGVQTLLRNPYLSGTAFQQAAAVADAAGCLWGIDDDVLWITPAGTGRLGTTLAGQAPEVSVATGMKEYPTFDKTGIRVTTLYNPAIKLGGYIVVKSKIQHACGTWLVHSLEHELETITNNGKWESRIKAAPAGGQS